MGRTSSISKLNPEQLQKYYEEKKNRITTYNKNEQKHKKSTEIQQKQILDIFNKLDEINVFHGDSNLLNYMLKNDQIYIIDFGMSKMIDDKLKKKLKENRPNFTLMNLGFILKLKELKCPDSSYKYLI
jgi:predicted unusual protein kinase regulating ubiquinone biosynthesis (AarF/ABC1/UbiB family)